MILAAGLGTRLRPLTDELPKPLCPVGDRPPVDEVVARLRRDGAARVVVNAFHLAPAWAAWSQRSLGAAEVVVEPGDRPLGTAGGVAHARGLLGDGDVVVWNGDVVADLEVAALLTAHRATGAFATLAVRRAAGPAPVGLDARGEVVRLRDHAARPEVRAAGYLGIAALSPACVAELPAEGCLVGDVWIPELSRGAAGRTIRAFEHGGAFRDVGSPAEYLAANLDWLDERGAGSFVAPGASVDPAARLRRVVVGEGARVEGGGELARVVVWPGAVARPPLADAIVTPRGVVQVRPAPG